MLRTGQRLLKIAIILLEDLLTWRWGRSILRISSSCIFLANSASEFKIESLSTMLISSRINVQLIRLKIEPEEEIQQS